MCQWEKSETPGEQDLVCYCWFWGSLAYRAAAVGGTGVRPLGAKGSLQRKPPRKDLQLYESGNEDLQLQTLQQPTWTEKPTLTRRFPVSTSDTLVWKVVSPLTYRTVRFFKQLHLCSLSNYICCNLLCGP